MKRFNTTGTCFPEDHYMVDISERIDIIKKMIEQGDYFCINRGRQYGKTTTLQAIKDSLSNDYQVLQTSFEGMGDSSFATAETLLYSFVLNIVSVMEWENGRDEQLYQYLLEIQQSYSNGREILMEDMSRIISRMCAKSVKPIVLLIDEVDQAGNYDSFIRFLGLLRKKFLARKAMPTFKSVILAGVYDIKNLKLKIRDENEHQYNSPWNIAVPFDVDMSLHANGIAKMLQEYQKEHEIPFDENLVANEIYSYTGGYPFLVSRLCQIIDEKQFEWNREGVVNAVHEILDERNTLFDEFVDKLEQFTEFKDLIKVTLFSGDKTFFNLNNKNIQLADSFGFIRKVNSCVKIANCIFEMRICNWFAAESKMDTISSMGSMNKEPQVKTVEVGGRTLYEVIV